MITRHLRIITIIVLSGVLVLHGQPEAEKPDRSALKTELETLEKELKPLRLKANLDPEVIAARAKLDEAFREFYAALNRAMKKIEPDKASAVDRREAVRELLHGAHGGSRAEHYEQRAERASQGETKE